MKNTSQPIDQYINQSADFAKPILQHFRQLVHEVCPDVEEKIKWGFPHFDYKNEMMCSMASFKKHCAITFWKAVLMQKGDALVAKAKSEEAMGHLGKISAKSDLPKDAVLKAYIKDAMRLNDAGIKLPARKKNAVTNAISMPDYFEAALKKDKKAGQSFAKFPPSHQNEYIRWITEAKTEATRQKRMATAIEWITEGKDRNWKYR